jgi:hypothetical protein
MRVSVVLASLLAFSSAAHQAAAQSGKVSCPEPGTRLTFSDGARIEAVGDRGNYVCRFKSLKTRGTFDRLLGSFEPTSPLVQPNADKFRSLIPLEVGRKIKFQTSGAGSRGADGFWFQEVSVERFERVVTPAGTFAAFVILYDEQAPQFGHGQWQYRYWYSPEVGHTVKFEFTTFRGNPPPNYPKNWELTAYAPAARAAGSPVQTPVTVPLPPAQVGAVASAPASKPPTPATAASMPASEPTKVAATAPTPGSRDGTWRLEMQVSTTYGTTVGGECAPHPTVPLTFVDGKAESATGKLSFAADGGMSGWLQAPSIGTSMLPFIVNVSGRLGNGVVTGSVSGRCTGSFTMRRP